MDWFAVHDESIHVGEVYFDPIVALTLHAPLVIARHLYFQVLAVFMCRINHPHTIDLVHPTGLPEKLPIWQLASRSQFFLESVEPMIFVALVCVAEHAVPARQYLSENH